MKIIATDSIVTVGDSSFRSGYLSLNDSYVQIIQVQKDRIQGGDTITRSNTLKIPFIKIFNVMDDFYKSNALKKQIKKETIPGIKKKLSQE